MPRRDFSAEFLTLERDPGKGKITGLSLALASWLTVDVLLIRALFVIASLSAGLGLLLYLAGWLLTTDVRTGVAPLDRVGTNWHKLQPRVVVGWTLAICAGLALTFGSAIGTRSFTVVVLVITGWLGWRSRQRAPQAVARRPQPSPARPAPAAIARPPVPPRITAGQPAGATAGPRTQTTIPLAVGTIGLAGLVGGAIWDSKGNATLALAAALLVVGLGLAICARRGRSFLLVLTGVLLTVNLASVGFTEARPAFQGTVFPVTQADLHDVVMHDGFFAYDLTDLAVTSDSTWTIEITNGGLELLLPPDQNTLVEVRYADAFVNLPDNVHVGDGFSSYQQLLDPAQPTLTVVVQVTGSALLVGVL